MYYILNKNDFIIKYNKMYDEYKEFPNNTFILRALTIQKLQKIKNKKINFRYERNLKRDTELKRVLNELNELKVFINK